MKKILILFALTPLIYSCKQCKYVTTKNVPSYQTDKRDIEVFITNNPPTTQYTPIGYLTCKCNNENKTYKKAKKAAAQHGGDAIVLYKEQQRTGWEKASNFFFGTNYKDKTKFIVVRRNTQTP